MKEVRNQTPRHLPRDALVIKATEVCGSNHKRTFMIALNKKKHPPFPRPRHK